MVPAGAPGERANLPFLHFLLCPAFEGLGAASHTGAGHLSPQPTHRNAHLFWTHHTDTFRKRLTSSPFIPDPAKSRQEINHHTISLKIKPRVVSAAGGPRELTRPDPSLCIFLCPLGSSN